MKPLIHRINTFLLLLFFFATSCIKENIDKPLSVRLEVNPESLNPVTFNRSSTRQIFDLIYQSLFTITLPNGELKPVLASELSAVVETDSGYFLPVQIRQHATWGDGHEVTSYDVAFTIKMLNLAGGEKIGIKNETSFIENFEIIDDKKITFKVPGNTSGSLYEFDDFYIYPEHLFDKKKVLREFSLKDILDDKSPDISKGFIANIQTLNFIENKELIVGSNAYFIENWQTGQQLTLTKKENYWFENELDPVFEAIPKNIVFLVIPNDLSAVVALENGQIDVLSGISPNDFNKLKTDSSNLTSLSFYTPGSFALTFFGVNAQKTPFSNKEFRNGLAWLIPYDDIIKVALHDVGERTVGFIHPHQETYYNDKLIPRYFNIDSSIHYFSTAGWHLKDELLIKNDVQAQFDLAYKKSAKDHEVTALLIQNAFQKAGIKINLHPQDGSLLNQRLSESDFDMYLKSLSGGPNAFNYEFIMHSDFTPPNGWNFSSFGTSESDSLIYEINNVYGAQARQKPLMRFQEIVFNECNVIALYNEKNTIIVNSNYENLNISNLKPGYTLSSFKLKKR